MFSHEVLVHICHAELLTVCSRIIHKKKFRFREGNTDIAAIFSLEATTFYEDQIHAR